MPAPTDKAGVHRLLVLAQYLSKFLPHLFDITKPLRELTQSDVQRVWGDTQQVAFDTLKKVVSDTPVLRYYSLDEEVVMQCDASQVVIQCYASQYGFGAAVMQNGQPVAYVSRAMTRAETRYAQTEKELLAIVFAVEHFEPYVYGHDKV